MRSERDALIGRARELSELTTLLTHEDLSGPGARLVTLTGPGGVGKTRVAMRLASSLADDAYTNGVVSVELRGVDDPERIAERIAAAAGLLTVSADGTDVETLVVSLRDRSLLLVLDNAEQLVDGVGDVVGLLLDHCPQLRILVTSRTTLELPGEQQYPLRPLAVAHPDEDDWRDGELADAVVLFRDRARQVQPGFAVDSVDTHAAIARICHRLGGFPLLVEIIAARVRMYPIAQLETRLHEVFTDRWGLRASSRTAWRTTFSSVMALSWDLCTPIEQIAWRRLVLFEGGFTADAARVVCCGQDLPPEDLDAVLESLVRQSLVHPDGHAGRLHLLEPIRQAGWARLQDAGEVEALRAAHAQWACSRAREVAAHWCSPDEIAWLDGLHADLGNVRAALDHLVSAGELEAAAWMLADIARARLPFRDGTLREWRGQLDRVLHAHDTECERSDRAWLIACAHAGWIAVCQGDPQAGELIAAARQAAGERTEPIVDYAEAVFATFGLADPAAVEQLQRVVTDLRQMARPGSDVALVTMWLGIAAAANGDIEQADTATSSYLAEAHTAGAPWHLSWARWSRAFYWLRQGDSTTAAELLHVSLPVQRRAGDHWGPIWWVALATWIATANGEPTRAAALVGATDRTMELTGIRIDGLASLRERHHAAAAYARAQLGPDRYDEVYAAGRAIPDLSTACDVAIEEFSVAPPEQAETAADTPVIEVLTEREREVAGLLARRDSNAEIAAHLVISQTTVKSHVRAVLQKLGCSRRDEVAAALAADQAGGVSAGWPARR